MCLCTYRSVWRSERQWLIAFIYLCSWPVRYYIFGVLPSDRMRKFFRKCPGQWGFVSYCVKIHIFSFYLTDLNCSVCAGICSHFCTSWFKSFASFIFISVWWEIKPWVIYLIVHFCSAAQSYWRQSSVFAGMQASLTIFISPNKLIYSDVPGVMQMRSCLCR